MTFRSGWNMPPGCFGTPYDEPIPPCEVCGGLEEECICPQCPICKQYGNLRCYDDVLHNHGLKRTQEQIAGRAERDKIEANEAAEDDAYWESLRDDWEQYKRDKE